jgi:hypothetical protein
MKITDLMIGDWFGFKIGEELVIDRISSILGDSVLGESLIRVKVRYLYPISIFPETEDKTLYRMKFDKCLYKEVPAWCRLFDSNYKASIYLEEERPFLSIDNDRDDRIMKIPCDYVHQIQHALKQINIEPDFIL